MDSRKQKLHNLVKAIIEGNEKKAEKHFHDYLVEKVRKLVYEEDDKVEELENDEVEDMEDEDVEDVDVEEPEEDLDPEEALEKSVEELESLANELQVKIEDLEDFIDQALDDEDDEDVEDVEDLEDLEDDDMEGIEDLEPVEGEEDEEHVDFDISLDDEECTGEPDCPHCAAMRAVMSTASEEEEDVKESCGRPHGKKRRKKVMEKKRPSAGLSKKERSRIVKAAKAGKDLGKPGKNFKKVYKAALKQYGDEDVAQRVAAAAMWRAMAKK